MHALHIYHYFCRFRTEYPQKWFNLLATFERNKKRASPENKDFIDVKLPFNMNNDFKKITGKELSDVIKEKGPAHDVEWGSCGSIRLKWEAVEEMFERIASNVVTKIQNVKNTEACRKVKTMLMVGGFSDSAYIQHEIKEAFERRLTIMVPLEAQMAIIKGAVLFGHKPNIIHARYTKFTYGVAVETAFKEGYHRQETAKYIDGRKKSRDVFSTVVEQGVEIMAGTCIERDYYPSSHSQDSVQFNFYTLSQLPTEPQYVFDKGVKKLGSGISVQVPRNSFDDYHLYHFLGYHSDERKINLKFYFGETEIHVEAFNKTTGDKAETKLEFL